MSDIYFDVIEEKIGISMLTGTRYAWLGESA